jgi:GntR family transcriptional repressor for pyruvate dehydrogenase complex
MSDQKMTHLLTTPVKKGSVVSLVMGRIKEAILNKELKSGDYLPSEAELTKNLGVSKSSVREAIKMLQALGVVEVRRGQGTIIRDCSSEDYISPMIFQLILDNGYPEDLVELRLMFEPAFSVMAMERATEEDRERIKKTLEEFEVSIKAGKQVTEDDIAFHLAILHTTRNPLVIKIGETIFQLFKPSISISMKNISEIALKDHKRIFEAFCKKDEAKLRKAILKSYEGWKRSLYRK